MNIKELSETHIRSKFITPAILGVGWDLTPRSANK